MNLRDLIFCIVFLMAGALCLPAATVEFEGGKAFDAARLRQAIAERVSEIETLGATPARADDAAFFLASFYRKEGYARAEVDYELRGTMVILRVNEGPMVKVHSLNFVGNEKVESAVLSRFFFGVPQEEIAAAGLKYHESEITAGADRVRGYYVSEGWLDAVVDTSGTKVSGDGTSADVLVRIVEGVRYQFGAVSISGAESYGREELIEALGMKAEGPFNPSSVEAMRGSLRSWLREKGHFEAEVTATAEPLGAVAGRIPVRFDVVSGPIFRITEVVPQGLTRLRPEFIAARFRSVTAGDYSPASLDEKYRELLRTGLFRSIRLAPVKVAPRGLRLNLEIQESKQKEFGFEAGYGSYDGITIQGRVADRNFLRTGRPLSLELKASQRGYEGELLHVDPWFLDSEWTLRTRLYSKVRDEDGYSQKGAGVRIDASRPIAPHWEFSAFTELAITNVTPDGIEPALLGPLDYTLMSAGIAQKIDRRDDPLNPRRGFLFLSSLELDALDGQLAFGRVTARYSHYRGFGKSLLAFGLRAGWIIPVGDADDVPIDLRYFNGGGGSVRSFSERNLGPKDSFGNPIGGSFYTVANLEWDFPIAGALGGALFADAGNLLHDATPGLNDLRFGIGAGLRYALPIGPMRIDYGYNPSPKPGEESGALHLSFGFAF